MNILEKLFHIQQETVAPKDEKNDFGGFKYRNVEGILKKIKPILDKYKCYVNLSDTVTEINGSTYIEARATIYDIETGESFHSDASAREMEVKKGMDSSQCTGSASSYARKYALQGLLGLDDSKTAPVIETDSQNPADHDEEVDLSRQTVLSQIYSLDITRKELDDIIQKKCPDKDADTLPVDRLKAIKAYLIKTRRGA